YCRWTGRHMCGAIGGGPTDFADSSNPDAEWYAACSAVDVQTFPYGDVYDPMACNGMDFGAGAVVPVGSLATCEGSLVGLFDMSGNVREWVNSCDGDPNVDVSLQQCQRRGGSYASMTNSLDCPGSSDANRSSRTGTTGIRCCG
ncbi:MAG: SUMF1/EgtB/PvdO family nonheme iron enzyme, partial [Myxococcales bacterium]|nr:SUMF1/EgtB/PvdO family nonheme iron enzyme [Myxococcales bacterium]